MSIPEVSSKNRLLYFLKNIFALKTDINQAHSSSSFLLYGEGALTNQTSAIECKTVDGAQNGKGYRMPVAGTIVQESLQFDCTAHSVTKYNQLAVYKNGSSVGTVLAIEVGATGDFGAYETFTTPVTFAAGDTITVKLAHNGNGLTTDNHAVVLRILTSTE